MGDDHPWPGIGVFQAMFSVAPQCTGNPVSVEWLWPVGPRNLVQFSARNDETEMNSETKQIAISRFNMGYL